MFDSKDESIGELLNRIRRRFGIHALQPYGDWDDPKSVGFRIHRVDATFSVVVVENRPGGSFNIQIESYPPGDYVYRADVTLDRFMELAELVAGPEDRWP